MSPAALRTFQHRAIACGWRAVVLRAAVLAAGWWILTEGESSALLVGAPVVLAALISSISLPSPSPPTWHPLGLLRLAWVFVVGSVHGGLDVACRALAPRLRIAPCVMEYTLRVPEGAARNLLLGTLTLMPGTLAVADEGQRLELHVIAARGGLADEIAALEASVARATGARLEEPRA
jgi:multicomponent Na+:H+ antiporter subunit E